MFDFCYNVMRAKLLTLSAIILTIASVASVVCAIVPYWLIMKINLTIEDDKITVERTIHTGLYFMDPQRFINIMMLDKAGNQAMAPPMIRVAQILYLLGTLGVIVCAGSAWILVCRKYASTTGEMCLATAVTPVTVSLFLGVGFVFLSALTDPNGVWHSLPVPDYQPNRFGYYKVLDAYPRVSLNWGTYVSCLALLLTIIGCVMVWIQACCTCKEYYYHRYQMLREAEEPQEEKFPAFSNVGYTKTNAREFNL